MGDMEVSKNPKSKTSKYECCMLSFINPVLLFLWQTFKVFYDGKDLGKCLTWEMQFYSIFLLVSETENHQSHGYKSENISPLSSQYF
jgi:hypothetical protein